MRPKAQQTIGIERIRNIVSDELRKLSAMNEQIDHTGIKDVVNNAAKLLAAVESFKESASPHVINAVTPELGNIEKTLENMVSNPSAYVQRPKKEPQRVSLKPVKGGSQAI